MAGKAVGFYWTLPVPWAGFIDLNPDIEVAARQSRTIAYQRAVIRRYASEHKLTLVHEEAFLEIDPDRGGEQIKNPLEKAARVCREHDAELLWVEFHETQGWRNHGQMQAWLERGAVAHSPVPADPINLEGNEFDPHAHFGDWRRRQKEWTQGKPAREEKALTRATKFRAEGLKNPAIARKLNEEGIRSATGKLWSADGVRKFLG